MYWFESELLAEIEQIVQDSSHKRQSMLIFYGSEGMGKNELVDFILSKAQLKKTIFRRLDFYFDAFSPEKFMVSFLQYHMNIQSDVYCSFMKVFSGSHRTFINKKLSSLPDIATGDLDLYEDLFLKFLTLASKNKKIFLVFENVDQIDSIQFTKINTFLSKFTHLPAQIIFTMNPDGPFHHHFPTGQEFFLAKLPIQTVEKCIETYFQTSPINARLLANHCYLKTSGIPLKTRMLLSSIYRPVIQYGDDQFLNLKELKSISLPESWENIFKNYYSRQATHAQQILAILAHIDVPFAIEDVSQLIKNLELPRSLICDWEKAGTLKSRLSNGQLLYTVNIRSFRTWLKKNVPIEKLESILLLMYKLMSLQKFKRQYQISDLLYDLNERNKALKAAELEANYYYDSKEFVRATDRLYFMVRILESGSRKALTLQKVLDQLGELYLSLGSYQNAFEILKKFRATITDKNRKLNSVNKKIWVKVNLKLTHCLIAMDAFQEARYLIRETKVKEFCDTETIGQCYEYLGDIESNLAHTSQALRYYKNALKYYQQEQNANKIFGMFQKLKFTTQQNSGKYQILIDQFIEIFSHLTQVDEYRGLLLLEKIQYLLNSEKYRETLEFCYQLWAVLQHTYQPRQKIQLAFYFGEIYALLGKWNLAISHLKTLTHRNYTTHRPKLFVQALTQLALIYKEQALYGESRKILEDGMDICFSYGYQEELNEIKLHLGHIYLLVHSLIRAHDFLSEAHHWALKNQKTEILTLSKLYLSYYELKHGRLEQSRKRLSEAKKLVNLSLSHIDRLNYLFYLAFWLLESKRILDANRVVRQLLKNSNSLPRYTASAYYLKCLANRLDEKYDRANKNLLKAMAIVDKWCLPQIKYLLTCEKIRLIHVLTSSPSRKKALRQACSYIYDMAEKIDDEILKNQFLESRFHEDILSLCKEFKMKNKYEV